MNNVNMGMSKNVCMEDCQSHITMLGIWIMLGGKRVLKITCILISGVSSCRNMKHTINARYLANSYHYVVEYVCWVGSGIS